MSLSAPLGLLLVLTPEPYTQPTNQPLTFQQLKLASHAFINSLIHSLTHLFVQEKMY